MRVIHKKTSASRTGKADNSFAHWQSSSYGHLSKASVHGMRLSPAAAGSQTHREMLHGQIAAPAAAARSQLNVFASSTSSSNHHNTTDDGPIFRPRCLSEPGHNHCTELLAWIEWSFASQGAEGRSLARRHHLLPKRIAPGCLETLTTMFAGLRRVASQPSTVQSHPWKQWGNYADGPASGP